MNWVGGVRSRIRLKQERKIQKEFFERKRLAKKVRRPTSSPSERRSHGTSQDLLSLQVIMAANGGPQANARKAVGSRRSKLPHIADRKMWKTAKRVSRRSNDASLHATLSLSPCHTPSQLDLDMPAPGLEEHLSRFKNAVSQKNELYKENRTASPVDNVLQNEEGTQSGGECEGGLSKQDCRGVGSEEQRLNASTSCDMRNRKQSQSGRALEGLLRQEEMVSEVQGLNAWATCDMRNRKQSQSGRALEGLLRQEGMVSEVQGLNAWATCNMRNRKQSRSGRALEGLLRQEGMVSDVQAGYQHRGRVLGKLLDDCVLWSEERAQSNQEREAGMFRRESIVSEAQGYVHCGREEKPSAECISWNEERVQGEKGREAGLFEQESIISEAQGYVHCGREERLSAECVSWNEERAQRDQERELQLFEREKIVSEPQGYIHCGKEERPSAECVPKWNDERDQIRDQEREAGLFDRGGIVAEAQGYIHCGKEERPSAECVPKWNDEREQIRNQEREAGLFDRGRIVAEAQGYIHCGKEERPSAECVPTWNDEREQIRNQEREAGLFDRGRIVAEAQGYIHCGKEERPSAECVPTWNDEREQIRNQEREAGLFDRGRIVAEAQGYIHCGKEERPSAECVPKWNDEREQIRNQEREAGLFDRGRIVAEAQGYIHCGKEERPSAECVPTWNEEREQIRDIETERLFRKMRVISSEAQGIMQYEEVGKDLYMQEQQECLHKGAPLDTQTASHDHSGDSPYDWKNFVHVYNPEVPLDLPVAGRRNIRPTDDEADEDMLGEKSPTEEGNWRRTRPTLIAAPFPPQTTPVPLNPGPSSLPEFDKQARDKEVLDEVLDLDSSQDDLSERTDSSWSVISSPAVSDKVDYKRPREEFDTEAVCGAKMKVDNHPEPRASHRVPHVTDNQVKELQVKSTITVECTVEEPVSDAKDGKERRQADVNEQSSLENSLFCSERAESLLTPQFVRQPNTPSSHQGQTAATEQNKNVQCSTQTHKILQVTPCLQGSLCQTDEEKNYGDSHTQAGLKNVQNKNVQCCTQTRKVPQVTPCLQGSLCQTDEEKNYGDSHTQAGLKNVQNKNVQCCTQTRKVPQVTPCLQGSLCQTDEEKKCGDSHTQAGLKNVFSGGSRGTINKKDDSCVCNDNNRRTSADVIPNLALKQDILRLEQRVSELESTNIYQALIIRILTQ